MRREKVSLRTLLGLRRHGAFISRKYVVNAKLPVSIVLTAIPDKRKASDEALTSVKTKKARTDSPEQNGVVPKKEEVKCHLSCENIARRY